MQSNKKKKRAKAETTRWHTPCTPCLTEKTPTSRKSTPRLDAETPLVAYRAVRGFLPLCRATLSRSSSNGGDGDPFSLSVFVLLEVAKRNGEARERDEERERAREREERERVRKVGKGGCGRKKRERDGSFEGLPRRGSQDLKKIGGE